MNDEYMKRDGRIVKFPSVDAEKVAAAFRTKPQTSQKRTVKALVPDDSPEPCSRCGIPGRKGCDHQLPFDGGDVLAYRRNSGHKF